MNSSWITKLVAWWKSWTGSSKEGATGDDAVKTVSERSPQDHARSRRIGFFRFYGQRVVDAVRRLYGRRRERTPLQRSLFFITGALVVIAAYLGYVGLPMAPAPMQIEMPDHGGTDVAELPPGEALPPSDELLHGELVAAGARPSAAEAGPTQSEIVDSDPVETAAVQSGASLLARGTESAPAVSERSSPQPDGARTSVNPDGAQAPSAPRSRPSLPSVSITSMILPVSGEMIQSYGWYRHPVFGDWRHTSSVVLKPTDDGNVRAALSGRVRDVVYEGGIWRVSIEHAGGWSTEYEGLLEVAVGSYQLVETGQVIGHIDPHVGWGVGFAVRQGDVAVNPLSLIDGGAVPASTN